MRIVKLKSLNHREVSRLRNRDVSPSPEIHNKVRGILAEVRAEGHAAVLRYARELDGLKGALRLTPAALERLAGQTPRPVATAIRKAIVNVRAFHRKQVESSWTWTPGLDVVLGQIIRPMRRVGVYVPGGAGSYPSTVIMNVVPAQVAGVEQIAVATPAARGLHPAVAFALRELAVKEIYLVGGAQAVGMLAYGTSQVERVDKIVGPGNAFVNVAKKEVFGNVDIDMTAGPSEILVLADETTDPDLAAADLLSQAEHGSGFEAAICITDSDSTAQWIAECTRQQVEASPKRALLEKTLADYGRIFVVPDWDMGVALSDLFAPEHLEILTARPERLLKRLRNAGAIFVGSASTEPVGDYFAGPNHVLPTGGSARFFSPLGTYDFYKRTSLIQYSRKALLRDARHIIALAEAEGFPHHAEAVRKRL